MNTARIVVLTIALIAGGLAAYLASGLGDKPPPAEAITLQTVDVLVAKSDIGLGQTVTAEALQWQTWPAATASNSFIRRNDRPEATLELKPEQAETLVRARQSGTMSPALRSIADVNATEIGSEDQIFKRGETVKVVRYGVSSPTTVQK